MQVLKKIGLSGVWTAIMILLFVGAAVSAYWRYHAAGIGTTIGSTTGNIVGTAIGSFHGATQEVPQGYADGAAAGLSAEDTTTTILDTLESVGTLEVMTANVTIKQQLKIGDAYQGLFLLNGDLKFTVDLSKGNIILPKDCSYLCLVLPNPEPTLTLNHEKTQKLAETDAFNWNLSAKDGMTAYLNAIRTLDSSALSSISNYDTLKKLAEEAAITQASQLIEALQESGKKIEVQLEGRP